MARLYKLRAPRSLAACGKYLLLLSCWLVGLASTRPAAAASGPGGVVLVMDASRSMQERLGDKSKMQVAQEVTGKLIENWGADLPIGLTVYGHRSASRCDDIEAAVPVGKLNAAAFLSVVQRLTPRGRTPLTAAVEHAASQLDYQKRKGTIILVSDGEESCGGDPCALAAELAKRGLDFTVHVVGFGLSSAPKTRTLSCLADETGGQYRGAGSAAELNDVLEEMVDEVGRRSGLPPSKPSLRRLPETTPAGARVKFRAVRVPGGTSIAPSWSIYSEDGSKRVTWSPNKTSTSFRLPEGRYRLISKYRSVNLNLPFDVSAGPNPVFEVAFNSARVSVSSVAAKDGSPLASYVEVWSPGGKRVDFSPRKAKCFFELFPGRYRLVVKAKDKTIEKHVTLSSGDEITQTIQVTLDQ